MSTSPFRRILIPVDFTDDADVAAHSGLEVESESSMVASTSSQALHLAAGIVAEGGTLCLVHATPSYETARVYKGGAGMGIVGVGDLAGIHANARAASLEILRNLVSRHAPNVQCTFVVRPGTAL